MCSIYSKYNDRVAVSVRFSCTLAAPLKHYLDMICVDLHVYVDMQGLICIRRSHCHSRVKKIVRSCLMSFPCSSIPGLSRELGGGGGLIASYW